MDYDGNIFDTALIGLLAALKNGSLGCLHIYIVGTKSFVVVRLPNLQLTESGEVLASEDRPHCLTLSHVPVALTFAMIDECVFMMQLRRGLLSN
jgi:exosome complex RNA-binding protein Rrp42 (RNase PH superfamily)